MRFGPKIRVGFNGTIKVSLFIMTVSGSLVLFKV